jgi:hypothetical protein
MTSVRKVLLAGLIVLLAQTPAPVEASQSCVSGPKIKVCGVWVTCDDDEHDVTVCADGEDCWLISGCPEMIEPARMCC